MAPRIGIRSSTPLRLSLGIASIYLVVGLVSFAITLKVVERSTTQTLQQTLEQEMAGLRAVPSRRALISLVRSQSEITDADERILSYVLPGGVLVGNAALFADGEGYRAVSFEPRENIKGEYFALGEMVHGGVLTIAISAAPLKTLEDVFRSIFLYSFVPTTLLVLLGSLLIAKRTGHRLTAIDTTLAGLTSGDFSARVPLPDREDDLGQITSGINKMAAAQQRQMMALQQVSSDIAHDLRTPIQRLSALVEQLASAAPETADVQSLSASALDETRNINQIFHALLQIAQVEGGSIKSQFKPVDVAKEVKTIGDLYRANAEDSGCHLKVSVPNEPLWVSGERTLIGQMLSNLVENTLRHTPSNTEISLSVKRTEADLIEVEVRDNGPGIATDKKDFVLRRLARLDESRSTPGHGLGLSLVAAIVDSHDGQLELKDGNPGLRVVIRFPMTERSLTRG